MVNLASKKGCAGVAVLLVVLVLSPRTFAADYSELASRLRAMPHGSVSQERLSAAASELRSAIARALPATAPVAGGPPAIDWTTLDAQAADPAGADAAVLRKIETAVRSAPTGFTAPVHRSLAASIARYARLVEASKRAADDGVGRKAAEQLASLLESKAKDDPAAGGSFGELEKAGPLLATLDDLQQDPGVVSAIRQAIGRPNVLVSVHESLLATAVDRPVDEVAPVDEVILGIRQRGTGHTQGFVRLDLVPSEDRAVLDLVLAATNHSNTRGGQGPVTVCSRGTTDLGARRRIHLEEERAYGLSPEAHAAAHSKTEGIGVRAHIGRNIIRNVASRRAASMRPQADAIMSGRARDRLLHRFGEQTQEAVDRLASNYQTQFREPLMLHDLYPEMLHHNTTDAAIHSIARKMIGGQVGAASSPPPAVEGAMLSARVHQTAVANAASSWLAGRTITKEQVEEEYRRRNRPLPAALAKGDDGDDDDRDGDKPWSVKFAVDRPLDLVVGDDLVTATLHGEKFVSGDRTVGPMDVKASYKIEPSAGGARLVRQGDLEVAPPGGRWRDGEKPNLDERVIRRRLRKRMETVLEPVIEVEPLALPGQLADAGPLPLHHLSARKDGWITAGWRKKDPVVYESAPVAEPLPAVTSVSTTSGDFR